MNIRQINQSDRDAWLTFRRELWPSYSDDHSAEIDAFFQGNSIDIDVVFVAENADCELVGFLELNLRDYAEGSRCSPIPYIEAWFVTKQNRGQGIGKALIQAAETWAIEHSFSEIASDTTPDNIDSIDAHKRLGFREVERVVCFLKPLENE
jgi:aminoglycoside 6'-N-acetyltransferase I